MVFHDGVGSPQRATKSEMAVDWEWSYDAGARRLYYRLTENPGRHRIEVVERNGIGWTSAHYITVRDLQIAYAEIGIGLHGSDGWVINGVSINDVVVDAIHGNGGAQAVQVVNSKIADWNWRGVGSTRGQGDAFKGYGIHVLGDALGVPSDEWTIEGNHLTLLNVPTGEDSTAIAIDMGGHARSIARNIVEARSWSGGGGIMVWRPLGYSSLRIEWNRISTVGGIGILVQDLGATGFVAGVEIAKNVVENPCGQDVFDEEAIRVWSGSNTTVIVADNVVNGVPAGRNRHVGIRVRGSRASVIGNTTLATDVGISVELGSSVEVRSNRSGGHRIAAFAVDSSSQYRASANVFD
jgi:hypothetical protein